MGTSREDSTKECTPLRGRARERNPRTGKCILVGGNTWKLLRAQTSADESERALYAKKLSSFITDVGKNRNHQNQVAGLVQKLQDMNASYQNQLNELRQKEVGYQRTILDYENEIRQAKSERAALRAKVHMLEQSILEQSILEQPVLEQPAILTRPVVNNQSAKANKEALEIKIKELTASIEESDQKMLAYYIALEQIKEEKKALETKVQRLTATLANRNAESRRIVEEKAALEKRASNSNAEKAALETKVQRLTATLANRNAVVQNLRKRANSKSQNASAVQLLQEQLAEQKRRYEMLRKHTPKRPWETWRFAAAKARGAEIPWWAVLGYPLEKGEPTAGVINEYQKAAKSQLTRYYKEVGYNKDRRNFPVDDPKKIFRAIDQAVKEALDTTARTEGVEWNFDWQYMIPSRLPQLERNVMEAQEKRNAAYAQAARMSEAGQTLERNLTEARRQRNAAYAERNAAYAERNAEKQTLERNLMEARRNLAEALRQRNAEKQTLERNLMEARRQRNAAQSKPNGVVTRLMRARRSIKQLNDTPEDTRSKDKRRNDLLRQRNREREAIKTRKRTQYNVPISESVVVPEGVPEGVVRKRPHIAAKERMDPKSSDTTQNRQRSKDKRRNNSQRQGQRARENQVSKKRRQRQEEEKSKARKNNNNQGVKQTVRRQSSRIAEQRKKRETQSVIETRRSIKDVGTPETKRRNNSQRQGQRARENKVKEKRQQKQPQTEPPRRSSRIAEKQKVQG